MSLPFFAQLPDHDEVQDSQFILTIRSRVGEVFVDKEFIRFDRNSRGMLVVKTDKPIYKPSQTSMSLRSVTCIHNLFLPGSQHYYVYSCVGCS